MTPLAVPPQHLFRTNLNYGVGFSAGISKALRIAAKTKNIFSRDNRAIVSSKALRWIVKILSKIMAHEVGTPSAGSSRISVSTLRIARVTGAMVTLFNPRRALSRVITTTGRREGGALPRLRCPAGERACAISPNRENLLEATPLSRPRRSRLREPAPRVERGRHRGRTRSHRAFDSARGFQ